MFLLSKMVRECASFVLMPPPTYQDRCLGNLSHIVANVDEAHHGAEDQAHRALPDLAFLSRAYSQK